MTFSNSGPLLRGEPMRLIAGFVYSISSSAPCKDQLRHRSASRTRHRGSTLTPSLPAVVSPRVIWWWVTNTAFPKNRCGVVLKIVDGDLEYHCLKPNGEMYDEMAFTISEREWIDDATDLAESLRRELNILIRVRPNYMILHG